MSFMTGSLCTVSRHIVAMSTFCCCFIFEASPFFKRRFELLNGEKEEKLPVPNIPGDEWENRLQSSLFQIFFFFFKFFLCCSCSCQTTLG